MLIADADSVKAAKESDRYNRLCKRARMANMSDSTVWYFADLVSLSSVNPDHAWKLAQIREELLNQGYDGDDLDARMEDFKKEITSRIGRRKKKQFRPQQQYQQQYYSPDGSYQTEGGEQYENRQWDNSGNEEYQQQSVPEEPERAQDNYSTETDSNIW